MLCADHLRWFAHGSQLVSQRMSPEVGQQQGAQKESKATVASTARRLHLGVTHGLHIKLQDHHRKDDHGERQDEGGPGFYFTLVRRQKEKSQVRLLLYKKMSRRKKTFY